MFKSIFSMAECEKIMCFENGNNNNALETAALMNNGNWGGFNSPWMFLLVMMLGGGGFGWNRGGDWMQHNDLSRQMQTLQGTVTDGQANQLALQAINGNRNAIDQLAQMLNTGVSNIQAAISAINGGIEKISGQMGYGIENIKNAITLGDANMMSKMQDCCCGIKTAILEQGYQSQLATERQTNALGSQMAANHAAGQLKDCEYHGQTMARIDQLGNNLAQGLAAMGYENAKNTKEIIDSQNAGVQRIADILCQNTTQQLRDQLAQKDRELMTASIVAQLKKECGCGC